MLKFLIHSNPQRLKHASCHVATSRIASSSNRIADAGFQFLRSRDRLSGLSPADNFRRDSRGRGLLTMRPENLFERILIQ